MIIIINEMSIIDAKLFGNSICVNENRYYFGKKLLGKYSSKERAPEEIRRITRAISEDTKLYEMSADD
jgi:hypothetical protein